MQTYAVLLRGVNVGGHNKVAMPALRAALEAAGFEDVRTYVQSGNAVLATSLGAGVVEEAVRGQLLEVLGLDVPVVARSGRQLDAVVAGNPFLDRPAPGSPDAGRQLHVAFMESAPDPDGVAALDPQRAAPEELAVAGGHLYLWCPDGLGRSNVLDGVERRLGTKVTVRNWRTVLELQKLAGAGAGAGDGGGG